jgi:hypothetical protein
VCFWIHLNYISFTATITLCVSIIFATRNGIKIYKKFCKLYFLMNFIKFNVNIISANMIMMVSIFVLLSTGSIIANNIDSNNGNIVFAQAANTTNSNTNASTSNNNATTANHSKQQQSQASSPANFTRALGSISSIQNNASGKPTWILSGQWDLAIPKPLKINQTNPPNAAIFNAGFEMIKTDGTSIHTHTISDFKLKGSAISGNALVLTGTATVSMKNGPVKDVPISITILNQGALNLFIDPLKTSSHFGNTPIYGTVSSLGIFISLP